jgi:nucleotide-binding universal stress UspA family protein
MSSAQHGSFVVVGVTDSAASRWALAWAVGTARRTGMALKVVVAFQSAPTSGYAMVTFHDQREAAKELIAGLFNEVCGGFPPDLRVQRLLVLEAPGRALVAAAGPGDLLVIGSSGRFGGATRRYCARRTRCPLVVVPSPDAGDLLGTPIQVTKRAIRPFRGR